jgi:hypothetical protein
LRSGGQSNAVAGRHQPLAGRPLTVRVNSLAVRDAAGAWGNCPVN